MENMNGTLMRLLISENYALSFETGINYGGIYHGVEEASVTILVEIINCLIKKLKGKELIEMICVKGKFMAEMKLSDTMMWLSNGTIKLFFLSIFLCYLCILFLVFLDIKQYLGLKK
jgi:hypothetical protein